MVKTVIGPLVQNSDTVPLMYYEEIEVFGISLYEKIGANILYIYMYLKHVC